MWKKKRYHVTLLLTSLIMACSKDFLDIKPRESTETERAITDLAGLRAAVNGMYSLMQDENYYGRTVPLLPDLRSDNGFISIVNSNRYRNLDQYIVTANDAYTTDTWNQLYKVVANANMIIRKGPHIGLLPVAQDSVAAAQMIAEAYAVRGLAFFDLVRIFAQAYHYTADASHLGIPLVTTIDVNVIQAPGRSTVKQTYDQIICDLTTAIRRFTAAGGSAVASGRMSAAAANALLSRVLLYKEDWQGAANYASAVISGNAYTLLPANKLVNDFKQTGNGETIFEIINTPVDNRSTDALSYLFSQAGYGDVLATDDLWRIYPEKDIRLGFLARDKRAGSGGENPANTITKYKDITTFNESIKVIRLAELYLTRAEALAHLGNETGAQADLQVIRNRANPGSGAITLTGKRLLKAILLERRRELAFEGHRLFDLARTGQAFVKHLAGNQDLSILLPNTKIILPIPQRELDANPNIRHQQNEGYN
ncbi:RagB/SusD family nutrient uptake outer membrane protein [Chitinophaga nivalis]|uniref:RagB/SusD family nutrient uptake outer membrane protein n=1 Tax=Chitinophaga nivalis TaxID=2991709 RepID=A0ABT3ILW0_9BACT|nr:RagB/SusD family nutrient uptake outer membrane protein [Chitinophaga nivalis]MCW3465590.1 RagB/SusD family nutrient uptake outer membrane protein [Chitinophaga nivalis]MCW3484719.1 RagB/SusD family nutrient uptake outer membrane protein [Chitinophaga nivalis]